MRCGVIPRQFTTAVLKRWSKNPSFFLFWGAFKKAVLKMWAGVFCWKSAVFGPTTAF
jgi:hypothetical protein